MVNARVNIRQEYYRAARSMCRQLFSTGSYYRMVSAPLLGGSVGDEPIKDVLHTLNTLEGILNHILQVKDFSDQRKSVDKKKDPTATYSLYRKFLFYKHFVALESPLVLPEGKTDAIYLQLAIRRLTAFQPRLGAFKNGKFESAIRFMNYSPTVHKIMQLGGGTGDMKHLILQYRGIT
jgi:RNA-directed DNA polymerase